MRLNIGIFSAKQLAKPIDSQLFYLVHNLATAIISGTGISLSIFVGQYGAHGLHDLVADEVFGCDQLNALHLTLLFLCNQVEKFGVLSHFGEDYRIEFACEYASKVAKKWTIERIFSFILIQTGARLHG